MSHMRRSVFAVVELAYRDELMKAAVTDYTGMRTRTTPIGLEHAYKERAPLQKRDEK